MGARNRNTERSAVNNSLKQRVCFILAASFLFFHVCGFHSDQSQAAGNGIAPVTQSVVRDQTQTSPKPEPVLTRIDADPKQGFAYPYYLRVPAKSTEATAHKVTRTLLVIPNNTGTANDDFEVHDRAARKMAENARWFDTNPDLVVLVPVFPRPKTDELIYTHALDRDTMLATRQEYRRLDRQLLAMIADARKRLARERMHLEQRILMAGFSASGMFVNRFVIIHPELIMAAAVGSPGGWPMVPVASWKGRTLRYPIGTADFKSVTGGALDLKRLRDVAIFFFLGSDDNNDSVVFRDSFDKEDEKLIFELFGKTLQERWAIAQSIYTAAGCSRATFKVYPGIGHTLTNQVAKDITAFFAESSAARPLNEKNVKPVARTSPIFAFHTDEFWLNLHHFLYVLGRTANKTRDTARAAVAGAPADQEQGLAKLKPAEQTVWREAVAAYAAGLSRKDIVFDDPLPDITSALAKAGDARSLSATQIDQSVKSVLERAAPIYRKAWWAKHREANHAWQNNIQKLIDADGATVLAFITNAYKMDWPASGFPVHISAYSNWAGAYSITGNLLVLSSLNQDTQGEYGFETIFHEGMHQWDDAVLVALQKEDPKLNKSVLDDLSHALIFFTAGEAIRRVIPGHVPYAEKFGVWKRGLGSFKPMVEEVWKPYLDGKGLRDEALAELVRRTAGRN